MVVTITTTMKNPSSCPCGPRHTAVVLFYKYFLPSEFPILHEHASHFEQALLTMQKALCQRLGLKGRVLLSVEGVNGTVSATSMNVIDEYIREMESFELLRDCGLPNNHRADSNGTRPKEDQLFRQVDWKKSCNESTDLPEPFPDLKITIVKEIISSGGGVKVDEIPAYGGTHLDPQEFHRVLSEEPNVVLIDVRNTFECDIGHFVNPNTNEPAIHPGMNNFCMFDDTFCAKQAEHLKDKKVLMYCTGGIRCEKASVMLKRRGVRDVSQLKGGIHRYLEEYGDKGYFHGRNFVFDQRIALTPNGEATPDNGLSHKVVGRCVACHVAFDELCGSRICTVCRDPVLVCNDCQKALREYHCRRHQTWKSCYFTFLEVFSREQLEEQQKGLLGLRDTLTNKNMRRTLMRQVEKVDKQIKDIDDGVATVNPKAPRRCRTCMEPNYICDGKCWGFWRATNQREPNETSTAMLSIQVGDLVEPGPNWNAQRLGTPSKDRGGSRSGTIVERKSWGSGGNVLDSVMVQWDDDSIPANRRSDRVPQIYRWGVVAVDGSRLYDVHRKSAESSSV